MAEIINGVTFYVNECFPPVDRKWVDPKYFPNWTKIVKFGYIFNGSYDLQFSLFDHTELDKNKRIIFPDYGAYACINIFDPVPWDEYDPTNKYYLVAIYGIDESDFDQSYGEMYGRNRTYFEEIVLNGEYIHKNVTRTYKNNKLHSFNDAPSYKDSKKTEYHFEGKLHRTTGPAYEDNFCLKYYTNGKLHNENGPAIIYKNPNHEVEEWQYYYNSNLHSPIDKETGLRIPAVKKWGVIKFYENDVEHRDEKDINNLTMASTIAKAGNKYDDYIFVNKWNVKLSNYEHEKYMKHGKLSRSDKKEGKLLPAFVSGASLIYAIDDILIARLDRHMNVDKKLETNIKLIDCSINDISIPVKW